MKKFILKTILMVLLVAASMCLMAFVDRKCFMADAYLLEFPVKQQLIRETQGHKIVFLGGSNLAFGIDSKTISDSLHRPVINAGLHAGLGLKFILDNNREGLRKGDLLVIMPEYNHFFGNTAYGENKTSGAVSFFASKDEWQSMNVQQLRPALVGFFNQVPQNFLDGCKQRLHHKGQSESFLYSLKGFNKLGDEVSHWTLPSGMDMTAYRVSPSLKDFNEDYFLYFVSQVNDLKARGVSVMILPPAVLDARVQVDKASIKMLADRLAKEQMPFVAPNSLFAYPSKMFYNSEYHLNRDGVKVNTNHIIEVLRNKI